MNTSWLRPLRVVNEWKSRVRLGPLGVIFLVLVLFVGGTTILIDRFVQQSIYDQYVLSLQTETNSFELALQQGLIQNDFNLVQQLLADLGLQRSVSAIRLVNADGRVFSSSIPSEIGVELDLNSPDCRVCHTSGAEPVIFHRILYKEEAKDSNIQIANALDNRVTCRGCHTEGDLVLGVMHVEFDAHDYFAWKERFTGGVYLGGGVIFLVLFSMLAFIFQTRISQPLRALQEGAPAEREASREDEIGAVARRIRELEEIRRKNEELAILRRKNFAALVAISESLSETPTIESVLRSALATIQNVTGFSTVGMRYYDQGQDCFRLIVQSGMSSRMVTELQRVTPDFPLYQLIMQNRKVVHISAAPDPTMIKIHAASQAGGFQTTLSVPFLFGERVLGSMELGSREMLTISEDQIRWLEVVGRVIGSLLNQVEMMERLRGMAMQQERAYVAQEIHDGIVQMLGSLRLWAEEAQIAMDEEDTRALQAAVRKIESTASDAYSSLREEMLGLRDTLQTGKGILPVVQEYLKRFQRQWGIQTELRVIQADGQGLMPFSSPAVEIQLLRMIQEGLTNVRRHARAKTVTVVFRPEGEMLATEIIDDGAGFDPQQVGEGKLGLRILRERAEQVGGCVSIEATPGQGTRLIIEVPTERGPRW